MSTTKISVTIEEAERAWLRRRAKVVHAGNLSAAFVEAARALRRQEALRAFLDAEGVAPLDPSELAEVTSEWRAPAQAKKNKRAAAR